MNEQLLILRSIKTLKGELETATVLKHKRDIMERLANLYSLLNVDLLAELVEVEVPWIG